LHHYNYVFELKNYDVEDMASFPQILTKLVEFTLKTRKFFKTIHLKNEKKCWKKNLITNH
jgi:hypothetical protein